MYSGKNENMVAYALLLCSLVIATAFITGYFVDFIIAVGTEVNKVMGGVPDKENTSKASNQIAVLTTSFLALAVAVVGMQRRSARIRSPFMRTRKGW